jgi:hypothetical protein
MILERMNKTNNREARAGSIGDRGPATISVPAENLGGEVQAPHGIGARDKLHAARWHMEDICSARCIEYGPSSEAGVALRPEA